jgi:hypothetical protein
MTITAPALARSGASTPASSSSATMSTSPAAWRQRRVARLKPNSSAPRHVGREILATRRSSTPGQRRFLALLDAERARPFVDTICEAG